MDKDAIRTAVKKIRSGMKITKVVCTRSVKGKAGDSYVGFSAAWNSVQEDGGQNLAFTGGDNDESETLSGMSLQEATVAACLLAREADLAAHNHALAGGNISPSYHRDAIAGIKSNYSRLIVLALNNGTVEETNFGTNSESQTDSN